MSRRNLGDNQKNVTRSEAGHIFGRLWRGRIYEKFRTWKTVTMRLGNGDLLTRENLNQKSKGMDLLIDVEAKNDAAGKRTANKIIKSLQEMKRGDDL